MAFFESLGAGAICVAVAGFILKAYLDRRLGKAGEIAAQLEKLDELTEIRQALKNVDHRLET